MLSKFWARSKISVKLAVAVSLLVLLPLLVLFSWLLENWRTTTITERRQTAAQALYAVQADAENTAELCNLSMQVFLNMPTLIEHLEALRLGEEIPSQQLLEFYRSDISSLERIVISNPYLYAIRVYSVKDRIDEMVPILYGAERMKSLAWFDAESDPSGWYFDYADTLSAYTQSPRIMGLVEPIRENGGALQGVIEVAVRMDQQFPELLEENSSTRCLIADDGGVYGNADSDSLAAVAQEYGVADGSEALIQEIRFDGVPYLLSSIRLEQMGVTYVQADSLSELYHSTLRLMILLWSALAAVLIALFAGINAIVKSMLRQLYKALEGVSSFAQGNLDIVIPVESDDEIGQFTRHVNGLLDSIRTLLHEQVQREVLIKNTEIHALQNQINAHFIYNVLEAIKMMAEIDEEYEIADAVTNLGQLLRYGMKWSRRTVALWQEIDYVKNYVALMNLRYDWVTTLQIEIPDELINQEIPKISLQPIVENAVVHGAAQKEEDCLITIRAQALDGCCRIEVIDDGAGLNGEQLLHLRRQISGEEETRSKSGNGIGLKNVQERIQMTFGEAYGLEAFSEEGQGTMIRILVPIHPDLSKEGKDGQGTDCRR